MDAGDWWKAIFENHSPSLILISAILTPEMTDLPDSSFSLTSNHWFPSRSEWPFHSDLCLSLLGDSSLFTG